MSSPSLSTKGVGEMAVIVVSSVFIAVVFAFVTAGPPVFTITTSLANSHRRRRRAEGDDGETYRVRAPARRASPPPALRTADARVVVADGMRTGEVDPSAVRPDVVVVIVVAAHCQSRV